MTAIWKPAAVNALVICGGGRTVGNGRHAPRLMHAATVKLSRANALMPARQLKSGAGHTA
jgi:hypothetical protein